MPANPASSGAARSFLSRKIRVRKEDSAYVYFILESYEGIVSYSTLEFRTGEAHRDLELRVPPDFQAEVATLLRRLVDEGVSIHEFPQNDVQGDPEHPAG